MLLERPLMWYVLGFKLSGAGEARPCPTKLQSDGAPRREEYVCDFTGNVSVIVQASDFHVFSRTVFFFGVTIAMGVVWDTAERAFSCFRKRNITEKPPQEVTEYCSVILRFFVCFLQRIHQFWLPPRKEIIKQIKRTSRSWQQYTTQMCVHISHIFVMQLFSDYRILSVLKEPPCAWMRLPLWRLVICPTPFPALTGSRHTGESERRRRERRVKGEGRKVPLSENFRLRRELFFLLFFFCTIDLFRKI